MVRGVSEVLRTTFKLKLPASDDEVTTDAEKVAAKQKNALAMSYLTLAMDSKQLLGKVEAVKSEDWPDGLACDLIKKLLEQYKQIDLLAVAEQQQKLMSFKLNKNQDPEELGDKIAALETAYSCVLDEKHKVAAIMNAAGQCYGNMIREVMM